MKTFVYPKANGRADPSSQILPSSGPPQFVEADFTSLLNKIQATALSRTHSTEEKHAINPELFHCDLFPDLPSSQARKALSRTFLDNLPDNTKQKHSCKACLEFIDTYGDLCFVDDKSGSLIPFFWPEKRLVPAKYEQAVIAIHALFKGKRITKPHDFYLDAHLILAGRKAKGGSNVASAGRHLHVTLPKTYLPKFDRTYHKRIYIDLTQANAMLQQTLDQYSIETIREADRLVHGRLPNSRPFQADGEWLKEVAERYHVARDPEAKWNLVRHHAKAVEGARLARTSNGLIGDLLFLIGQGMGYHDIQERWNRFLRVDGVRVAEKGLDVPERRLRLLGYTKADLERYLVAPEELPESAILWKNKDSFRLDTLTARTEEPGAGAPPSALVEEQHLLSALHLEDASPTSISFRSFVRRVIPKADAMELFVDKKGFKATLFTRGGPNAKSPFVFDSADKKNTMSWYTQDKLPGSNLQPGWNVVSGIVTYPHMWGYLSSKESIKHEEGDLDWPHEQHGIRFLFCLRGIQCSTLSRGLFNTRGALKSALEAHPVKKLLKKFDNTGAILGRPEHGIANGHIGGVEVRKESWETVLVRVRNKQGFVSQYDIALFD
ncbi:hypothetical protein BKA70DRAFT_1338250 [Coprinopsis sp. MPI-PUGE-AT-0042]|nr:hypothetical protein BKA70DRAFT_1338250 [Coprinopsis sp. MPI-PUGE-AT-0042]